MHELLNLSLSEFEGGKSALWFVKKIEVSLLSGFLKQTLQDYIALFQSVCSVDLSKVDVSVRSKSQRDLNSLFVNFFGMAVDPVN